MEDRLSVSLMGAVCRDGLLRGHSRFGVYLYDDSQSFMSEEGGARKAHRSNDLVPLVAHLDGGSFVSDNQRCALRQSGKAEAIGVGSR